ncbi:hypothetical protein QEH59_17965 [Coraliomargarita sp. SDUM461004]|uniref:Uncharacterized protein n=1 Tax=Thalassobacterium sedimentorum TaxID=3041258 RepID=A0ABU1ANN3_9BACT|nr:hypothetical protein [Coraliomargarita sp. SDUM461004]MDQ8196327.1 hypothetical protein [Coraliomargarita sp. SDUM461004]
MKDYQVEIDKGINNWKESRRKSSSPSREWDYVAPRYSSPQPSNPQCNSCGADWSYGVSHSSWCSTQRESRLEIQRRLQEAERQRALIEEEQRLLKALNALNSIERQAFADQNYFDEEDLSSLNKPFSGDMSRYDEGFSMIPEDVQPYIYKEFFGDPGNGDVRITFSESGIPKALSPGQITDLPTYKRREDGNLVRQVLGKPVNGIIPRLKKFTVDDTSQAAWIQNQKYGTEKMSFAEFKARQYQNNADGRDQAIENALETMDRLQKEGRIRMSITEQNAVEAIMRSRLEDTPLDVQMDAVNATKIQLVLDAAKAHTKPVLTPPEAELPSPQEVEAIINLNKSSYE